MRLERRPQTPAALLVAATVGFGLDTSFTVDAASKAATWLMGATR